MKRILKQIMLAGLVAGLPALASARVVLHENFEGGVLPPGFAVYSGSPGSVTVEDVGGNKVLKLGATGVVAVGDTAWTDYTVQARVFVYDGSYWAYAAGLLFRGTGDYNASSTADCYVWQTRPGEMQFEKWIKDAWWQHLQDDYGHSFPPGEWHTLKVVARGTWFQFYLDGVLVNGYTDPAAPLAGQVGFRTWGAGAYFDDLVVEVPDAPGVLLSEDFEYGTELHPGWARSLPVADGGPTARLVDVGGRKVLDLDGTGSLTIGDASWGDYTAEVDVFVHDTWYWAYAAGLMVRSRTPALPSWDQMDATVWQGRSPSYYGPGLMQSEKWSSTQPWSWLWAQTGTAWTDGAWHRLKVITSGTSQRLYLDGVQLAVVNDAQMTGYVGLRAYVVGAYFDDLLVRVNDTAAPVTAATIGGRAGANGWLVSAAGVSLRAADAPTPAASGVREVRFSLDGAAEAVVPGEAAEVALADGVHALTFNAVDRDDNVEVAQALSVNVDGAAPVLTLAAQPASLVENGRRQWLRVVGSAADATSGVASTAVTITNASGAVVAQTTLGGAVQLLGSRHQRYTITAVSTDVAGNVATATVVVPVLDEDDD